MKFLGITILLTGKTEIRLDKIMVHADQSSLNPESGVCVY